MVAAVAAVAIVVLESRSGSGWLLVESIRMQLAADSGARAASGSRGQHDYDSQCKYTCTDAPSHCRLGSRRRGSIASRMRKFPEVKAETYHADRTRLAA